MNRQKNVVGINGSDVMFNLLQKTNSHENNGNREGSIVYSSVELA